MKPSDKDTSLKQDLLKSLLHYDQDTGIFTWLVKPRRAVYPGAVAGHKHKANGYWQIKINNRHYLAHRLAWLYMTGLWPIDQIDHIDGNRSNNCWFNLRAATASQNGANMKPQFDKDTKGVRYRKDRSCWTAYIRVNGVLYWLGSFQTKENAEQAYAKAADKHFGSYKRIA